MAARLLNEGLDRLSKWCLENKLTINVKKTKHLIISPPSYPIQNDPVTLNGERLDIVDSYNYLGVLK